MEKLIEIEKYFKSNENFKFVTSEFIEFIEKKHNFRCNNIPNLYQIIEYHFKYSFIDFKKSYTPQPIVESVQKLNKQCFDNLVQYFIKYYQEPYMYNDNITNTQFQSECAQVNNSQDNCWDLTDNMKQQFYKDIINRASNTEQYYADRLVKPATPYDDF